MQLITVYTSDNCRMCDEVKRYFLDENIDFQEVNVSHDRQAEFEMLQKYQQENIPIVVVNTDGVEDVLYGFDQEALEELLDINEHGRSLGSGPVS